MAVHSPPPRPRSLACIFQNKISGEESQDCGATCKLLWCIEKKNTILNDTATCSAVGVWATSQHLTFRPIAAALRQLCPPQASWDETQQGRSCCAGRLPSAMQTDTFSRPRDLTLLCSSSSESGRCMLAPAKVCPNSCFLLSLFFQSSSPLFFNSANLQ